MLDDVRRALASVVSVPVTPFDDTGGVDEKAYAAVVSRMVEAGVTAVTPGGNTGEFYSLSDEERNRVVALTAETAGDARVIAGVGHDAARAARQAVEAAELGAHAVMVHQPVHPYQSQDGWVDYHRAVAEAVPELGVVSYLRSPLIGPAAVRVLAAACPNLAGVKYAIPDPVRFAEMADAVPELTWVCGLAESWAPFFWPGGARGFTSGLAAIAPGLSLELHAQLEAGDTAAAMRLWRRLKPIEDLRARRGNAANVSVLKEALAQLGVCRREVRPPISELPPAEREEVTAVLRSLDLLTVEEA
ncbi:dihydrodipicolinate synthase family protein [Sphaerisporangium melleum]|uniref:Dihydrodipicolinate synthase family protein n=1 Tax=Sphaerisporangium melleum TaxID=321316 RepID=A0A917QSF4_9ACTN|nr:dihydrodipicolinate synthase family protein [Sphaerisporangium melleum]GGK66365.1 dihydrodipicolinate synthase family protein [Sphaerisporangium melleum]GII68613.1 dihydrodipicolinate synthase family protein [Sphaerisporangium melleum]